MWEAFLFLNFSVDKKSNTTRNAKGDILINELQVTSYK